ncbi:hypothetical protein OAF78_02420 [Winogradskyella sp.]|nr:hypothetical protein [Winogradskyella sp.]MDB4752597.1 hypothetical protein [Winogradskyella sp.]
MRKLFEKTDYEIELYIEDAMYQDKVFRSNQTDPDSMEDWFQKRKQRIFDMFLEEYTEYEYSYIYFFGCSMESYKFTFFKRKQKFIQSFADYDDYDFLMHEFNQGIFSFNRNYMDPKMLLKIEASLRKRYLFLKEKAEELGYSVELLNDNSVKLIQENKKSDTIDFEEEDEGVRTIKTHQAPTKVLFLNELGIIDLLSKNPTFMASTNALCTAIGHAVGERADTLRRAISPLLRDDKNDKRHPYNNNDNVQYVKNTLNHIGFY